MHPPIANYQSEQKLFADFLAAESPTRILFFRGKSGSGKTTLLKICRHRLPANYRHIGFECKDRELNTAEVFARTGDQLGWPTFPAFTRQVAALNGLPTVQVERNWQTGSNNQINVALNVPDLKDREQRRVDLTRAWFDDLRQINQPLLLMIDTYEQAPEELKKWLAGPFLARVERTPHLRVLMAGQETPDTNNIEWDHCCQACDLYGVREAHHWLPVLTALNRRLEGVDPISWLAGICYVLRDKPPAEIMKAIESLPRQERQP